jgi:hypothetical protein
VKVAWVHPSWRDLVIDELRADPVERRAFLRRASLEGVLVALSTGGGAHGERTLPLLVDDADWDVLGDQLVRAVRDADDHDALRVLGALAAALRARLADPAAQAELEALAASVLATLRRRWDAQPQEPIALGVLDAWCAVRAGLASPPQLPRLAATWFALLPDLDAPGALAQADDWLALAQLIHEHDPQRLDALGFPAGYAARLEALAALLASAATGADPDAASLGRGVCARLFALPGLDAQTTRIHEAAIALNPPPEPTTSIASPAPEVPSDVVSVGRILRDL